MSTSSSLPVTNKQFFCFFLTFRKPFIPRPDVRLPDFASNPPLDEVLLNPLTEELFKCENETLIN